MLEHQFQISVNAEPDEVWAYVSNMANWASNMPGFRSYEVFGDKESKWVLKVGVGTLVRTVTVIVTITAWEEPERVRFVFRFKDDPVEGSGSYAAEARGAGRSEMLMALAINGRGPLAAVWEAMATPVLPKLAATFAVSLKDAIEGQAVTKNISASVPTARPVSMIARLLDRILGLLRRRFLHRS